MPHLEPSTPCQGAPETFFADDAVSIATAKALCVSCPAASSCLTGALSRREPWGVWGGALFESGSPVGARRAPARTAPDYTPSPRALVYA